MKTQPVSLLPTISHNFKDQERAHLLISGANLVVREKSLNRWGYRAWRVLIEEPSRHSTHSLAGQSCERSCGMKTIRSLWQPYTRPLIHWSLRPTTTRRITCSSEKEQHLGHFSSSAILTFPRVSFSSLSTRLHHGKGIQIRAFFCLFNTSNEKKALINEKKSANFWKILQSWRFFRVI